MALRARNPSPWGLATLNHKITCYGPRPGPKRVPWCSGGLLACPGAESTRKDPRPEEKKWRSAYKSRLYMVIYYGILYVITYSYPSCNEEVFRLKAENGLSLLAWTRLVKARGRFYQPLILREILFFLPSFLSLRNKSCFVGGLRACFVCLVLPYAFPPGAGHDNDIPLRAFPK